MEGKVYPKKKTFVSHDPSHNFEENQCHLFSCSERMVVKAARSRTSPKFFLPFFLFANTSSGKDGWLRKGC